MFRFTRPLLQASKLSTGIHGLSVHPNPLPELTKTYESTLSALSSIPKHAAYRQGAEALTLRKLKIVQDANGDVAQVEKQLDEGQIEQAIAIAKDELGLVGRMTEWKAWEPLEEKPEPGQWEYFGKLLLRLRGVLLGVMFSEL
ncbi:ETC complex I subunit conserved region-domain-containing protein [Russula vinacea]|nr:ETC complex I subunit conserved region-domain-containing protein [Russula vinacea]